MNELQPLLNLVSGKIPWLVPTLALLMALRLPMKIISGWLQAVLTAFVARVATSPETDDDELLRRVLGSMWYRILAFTLDAVFSLKLPTADSLTLHQIKPITAGSSGAVLGILLIAGLMLSGCAPLQPGADPLVVNVERAQTIALPTFDLVLSTDHANRGFWQTNAPAFHTFCEWLRADQIAYLADGSPTNVQRAIALQLNLDKVKLDYQASRVSANALTEALATLQSATRQASAWLTIATNTPPVKP